MIWLLVACHHDLPDDDYGPTHTTDDGIPDPYAGLDRASCEGGGIVTNVATAWYVGDLTVMGTTFFGTETAAVRWSPGWVDTCGFPADCTVVWNVEGDVVDPVSCPGCSLAYSLEVSATLDDDASDCPTSHRTDFGDRDWSTTYDVKLLDDGTSEVSFADSGNALGGWYWSGERVTYVSDDPVCNPYPDDLSGICD
jgi:hypothetical protein